MPSDETQTIPQTVLDLVERFERNRDAYKTGNYNETQVRREFIDPFCKALGWDIDNEQGYAEAYKDVIHEDAIKVGEATKAPDYCFRIGGTRKFFLEAKKPAVDIKNDVSPAFQLRRYGWTTKLPLSILTDFEEFAVYDCRYKPDQKDSAATSRILYIRCTEYATRWHEIASVFSRDAVLKGSFDKFAESSKAKRGTADVDDAFLETIETWRKELAENLALRNKQLSQRELNFAVQRIIDRIIFLRICEGRGIEDYGRLRTLATGDGIYPRLGKLFKLADDRYNSGLFHFKAEKGRLEAPDELTLSLALDDKLLRGILKSLYYPDSPYVFSALPADVLGQVYEQFLGKVIRLTDGHRAKVEDKPEVKKAGGVYYTPTYIVDYIVQQTVGKLLENKTPKQAAALTTLDPACGSGSFLLGAYEYLLQWHLAFYTDNTPAKWTKGSKPVLVQTATGSWKLTIAERKRILLDNIYGVDIDAQAVETTKLSLLLKVLEGETSQTIQPELLHERALPDLSANIKCGNSLIGPDFYQQEELVLLNEEERYRVNVFNLPREFPSVFQPKSSSSVLRETPTSDYTLSGVPLHGSYSEKTARSDKTMPRPKRVERAWEGGFDAVIGNPPYGAATTQLEMDYFRAKYQSPANSLDTFLLFVERAQQLLKSEGLLGMILPSGWVSAPSAKSLRDLFLLHFQPVSFVSLPFGVFRAYIDTVIVIARNVNDPDIVTSDEVSLVVCPPKFRISSLADFGQFEKKANYRDWLGSRHVEFLITCSSSEAKLLEKVRTQPLTFGDVLFVKRGIEAFHPTPGRGGLLNPKPALASPFQRYDVDRCKRGYVAYSSEVEKSKPFEYFSSPRILLRQVLSRKLRLQAVLTADTFLTNQSVQSLIANPSAPTPMALEFLVGILNSRLISWYFVNVNSVARRDDFPKIIIQQTREMPLPGLDSKSDKAAHDKIVKLVEQMLEWHKRLPTAKTPQEKTSLERQISSTDTLIDRLVYDLYGLTAEEEALIKG